MPRRPRPASRGGDRKIKSAGAGSSKIAPPAKAPHSKRNARSARPVAEDEDSDSDGDDEEGGNGQSDEDEDEEDVTRAEGSSPRVPVEADEEDEDEDDNDDDADAPRVALWEPDDDEQYLNDSDEEEEEDQEEEAEGKEKEAPAEKTLKNTLQDLPLGALRQAQRMLAHAEPDSDSGSESEDGSGPDEEGPPLEDSKVKRREKVEKVEWSAKRRKDIEKRSSKHAPIEVTSKRPVTRTRQVVEVPKIVPRDPRFLPTAGEFDASRFSNSYGFLAESHKTELATLRSTLARARKLLDSSPRDLRAEREAEVYRLEQAVKRAESLVNRDRLDAVEREALGKVKKVEKEGRAGGKGEWYMKRGEKQKLVVQARYEALATEGGQRAVKKAIERKQKKVSQKEKRSRPYAKGEYSGGGAQGERPFKRQRV